MTCTAPVVSQLKLVKQILDFSGVTALDTLWSCVHELKSMVSVQVPAPCVPHSDQCLDPCSLSLNSGQTNRENIYIYFFFTHYSNLKSPFHLLAD